MEEPDPSDICLPITDISLVLQWLCDGNCWIHKHDVVNLNKRSNSLNLGCVLDSRSKNKVFPEYKIDADLSPKTIFCHDFKGGYLEDRFCNGSPNINTYRFFNWAGIDAFIYFSHKLVTIPPYGWLNAGHTHGVPVLGTVITEWKDGEAVWRGILTSREKTRLFAQKLAEICAHYMFDGYLLNVENVIPKDFIPRLVQFVALLKSHLDLFCGKRTWLIWYDSVTTEGNLDWQNKLCPLNKPFFDVCDGIFLNYVWKPADLLESLEVAGDRKHDVFVGVDAWGRNCYQDGGFDIDKAMAVIRNLNMSVALFGLGWTFETLAPGEHFLPREIKFWKKFWPYLYTHGPAGLPFQTDFCQGISYDKVTGKAWFNLAMQQYQPTGQGCSTDSADESCVSLYLDDGILYRGACLKVSAISIADSKIFQRVFVCDFANNKDKTSHLLVTLALKSWEKDPASRFRIYFVLEDRLSIEGKQSVSMNKRPKGYRANMKIDSVVVSGSLIDFTAEKQTAEPKIKVLHSSEAEQTTWHQIKFVLELNPFSSLTELLVLPAPQGSILWGQLRIEEFVMSDSVVT